MEKEFSAAQFLGLDAKAQTHKCRELALQAKLMAETCSPEMRHTYLEVAKGWRFVADRLEQGMSPSPSMIAELIDGGN